MPALNKTAAALTSQIRQLGTHSIRGSPNPQPAYAIVRDLAAAGKLGQTKASQVQTAANKGGKAGNKAK